MFCVSCFSGPFIDETPLIEGEDGNLYCEHCIPDTPKNREVIEVYNLMAGAKVIKTPGEH